MNKITIILSIGLILTLAAASWGLVVIDENFNSYAVNSKLNNQGRWVLESGVGGRCTIQDGCPGGTTCPQPERVAQWKIPPGSGESNQFKNVFPVIWNKGMARLYISIMIDATALPGAGGFFSYVRLYDDKGVETTRIYISRTDGATGGGLAILGRQGSLTGPTWQPALVQNAVNGVWYHIKLEVNATNKKYDAYIGDGDRFGGNEGHWTKVVDDAYFHFGAAGLASLRWQIYNRASEFVGNGYVYLDNIYIDGPDNAQGLRSTEIWVGKGVYKEQVRLAEYTHLYGGFAGTETSVDQRKPMAYRTIIDPGDTTKNPVTAALVSSIDGFTVRGGGSGIDCSGFAPVITNNIITGNRYAGVYTGIGTATIWHNVIIGNGYGVYAGATPDIGNNIVAYNSQGIIVEGGSPKLSHNDVFGNTLANYNGIAVPATDISVEPQFASLAFGDYHIRQGSPCRDAGDVLAMGVPGLDMDGQVRPEGSAPDIGVDESAGEPYPDPYSARIIYVDSRLSGGDGKSWQTAYGKINDATADVSANGGAEIWSAEGIYAEKVGLCSYAYLYGGFKGDETSQEDRDPCVNRTVIDAGSRDAGNYAVTAADYSGIDGFSIRNGYRGVFSLNAHTTIANNTISGNADAGIHEAGGFAEITNNVIFGNEGWGILSGPVSGVVTNNTVAHNRVGIYCVPWEAAELANNIVAFNSTGIAAAEGYTLPDLSHNNVFGNSTENYDGLAVGSTDISVDPQFMDAAANDYHIGPLSLCIDAGYNGAECLPKYDMDWCGRIKWSAVDIGADELWPADVDIDIKPGENPNVINLKSHGKIPVALLGSADLDVTKVDPATIRVAGAPIAVTGKDKKRMCSYGDANHDGIRDLVMHIETDQISLSRTDTKATMSGRMYSKWPIEGIDNVAIVPR